jgi:hypothetical protein
MKSYHKYIYLKESMTEEIKTEVELPIYIKDDQLYVGTKTPKDIKIADVEDNGILRFDKGFESDYNKEESEEIQEIVKSNYQEDYEREAWNEPEYIELTVYITDIEMSEESLENFNVFYGPFNVNNFIRDKDMKKLKDIAVQNVYDDYLEMKAELKGRKFK